MFIVRAPPEGKPPSLGFSRGASRPVSDAGLAPLWALLRHHCCCIGLFVLLSVFVVCLCCLSLLFSGIHNVCSKLYPGKSSWRRPARGTRFLRSVPDRWCRSDTQVWHQRDERRRRECPPALSTVLLTIPLPFTVPFTTPFPLPFPLPFTVPFTSPFTVPFTVQFTVPFTLPFTNTIHFTIHYTIRRGKTRGAGTSWTPSSVLCRRVLRRKAEARPIHELRIWSFRALTPPDS